jgi:CubicO group peptidase (beta-lactamase class C family)
MESMSRRDFLVWPTATAAALAFVSTTAATTPPPEVALPGSLRRFIGDYMSAMNAPGLTLSLASRDGSVATEVFGFADLAAQIPVSIQHRFEIGSITKSFVALMILRLQDEGKLDLQHPILRYLPWLPIEATYGEIRIHHLLTHTAGLPSDAPLVPERSGARLRQAHKPGSQFHYCNWGYLVLGRLIESIEGASWATVLGKRILAPLGMVDTAPVLTSELRSRIAPSYVPLHDDRPYPRHGPIAPAGNLTFISAAGCIASTPADMGRYMQMLLNRGAGPAGRIVSEEAFSEFSTPHIAAEEFGPGAAYGYGIAIDRLDGHKRLRHTGGMISFMSALQLDLDAGIGAFASINAQLGYRPNPIVQYAVESLRAERDRKTAPSPPAADETQQLKDAAGYGGLYRAPDGRTLEVVAENGRLVLVSDGARIPLQHLREDQFVALSPKFALYSIVFGRAAQSTRDVKIPPPVVDLGHGPDWYAHIRYAGSLSTLPDTDLTPYAGLYNSNDAWVGTLRIVVRRGQLWIDGEIPLIPVGDRLFQFGDEPASPETAEFGSINDGKAEVLIIAAGSLRRVE